MKHLPSVLFVFLILFSLVTPTPAFASTLSVTTAADVFDVPGKSCYDVLIADLPGADGRVSLREAICAANNTGIGAPHTIHFSIGSGTKIINIANDHDLPALWSPMTIDGTTQPGYDGTPLIILRGGTPRLHSVGLFIGGGNTTLRGLGIQHFYAGIYIEETSTQNRIGGSLPGEGNWIAGNTYGIFVASDQNTIQGNFIGVDALGSAAQGNDVGIYLRASANNLIGGTTNQAGNLISGNRSEGVVIYGDANTVQGNKIGTDITGNLALPNGSGVKISTGSGNLIGGTAARAGNLISGNQEHGIKITQRLDVPAHHNLVQGNKIGVNAAGTAALGNGIYGVFISDALTNTIGGAEAGAGNLISGNRTGVMIFGKETYHNQLVGNWIGVNASGNAPLGNQTHGVVIDAPGNTVRGNVISGNEKNGLLLKSRAENNTVQGNQIGVDASGSLDLGNKNSGIVIDHGLWNLIGGGASGQGNVISGNGLAGIVIRGSQSADSGSNLIQGNQIGVDVTGSAAVLNGQNGIYIDQAPNNQIGGDQAGQGNLISGNDGYGILVRGANAYNTWIAGNLVGVNAAGEAALGNTYGGIALFSVISSTIGGPGSAAGNLVSGNQGSGIAISSSSQVTLYNNRIGVNASASTKLGNTESGVEIWNSAGTLIGAAGQGNIIAGNALFGVHIFGAGSQNNALLGNWIGSSPAGANLGNSQHGVLICDSSDNPVGGPEAQMNTIAYNGQSGAVICGLGARNPLHNNLYHDNQGLSIDLGNDGLTANDPLDLDEGANLLQNRPVLAQVYRTPGSIYLRGSIDSTPNTTFTFSVYANPACHASGYGEGHTLFHQTTLTTNAYGQLSFLVTLDAAQTPDLYLAAVLTDPDGNSSEFSNCLPALAYLYLPILRR